MKKLMMLALAGSFVFGMSVMPVQAQMGQGQMGQKHMQKGMNGKHYNAMNAEQQLKHLTVVLDLTAEQQAKIKPILEEREQQRQEMWKDNSLSRTDRQQKMMALREESKTKIEAVLNDQQKEKYEKLYEMNTERMQQQMKQNGMPQH